MTLCELSFSSVSADTVFLAVIPVPLTYLLTVHLNQISHLDALLDVPLEGELRELRQ